MEECWSSNGASLEWGWMGLLLAILSAGLYYMERIEARNIGFSDAMHRLAMVMYDTLTSTVSQSDTLVAAESRLQELLALPPIHRNDLPYQMWSRHVFLICVHHRRLVLHRPLFARSFKDSSLAPYWAICLGAAESILDERRKVFPASFEKLWSIMFQTLAAAVVLIIELFHSDPRGPFTDARRVQVYEILEGFSRGLGEEAFVRRTLPLLMSLLREEDKFRSAYMAGGSVYPSERDQGQAYPEPERGMEWTPAADVVDPLNSDQLDEGDLGTDYRALLSSMGFEVPGGVGVGPVVVEEGHEQEPARQVP
ncbi:hypothetical protein IAT38_001453 [Cryptococcus sp. DSM 104549]